MRVLQVLRVEGVIEARFNKRPNRFVVEAVLDGKEGERRVRCLNTNTGRLLELLKPGARLYCVPKTSGKTTHRLLAVAVQGGAAIVDTGLQMRVFERMLERSLIPWLEGCKFASRSPRLGGSVLDYRLDCGDITAWVEVKSAVLLHGRSFAGYPDCPTDRGIRHIGELAGMQSRGRGRRIIVFIAALPGAWGFKPYSRGDPRIVDALNAALEQGVEVRSLGLKGAVRGDTLEVSSYSLNLPIIIP